MALAPLRGTMAAIWKGSIAFGLVNVPIELRAAVREDDGKNVKWEDIVKGYEYEKGQFVVLTDEDFKAAALENSESIEISDLVDADEIDPRYFETPYFAISGKGGTRAYAVLREGMRKANVVGVGTVILRQKQHLAGLHVMGDAMVVEIMRFANEIVPASEYTFPTASETRPKEVEMAHKLIESLHSPFEPEKYADVYRANLLRVITAKSKGKKVSLPTPAADKGDDKVLDLMQKLEASLRKGREGRAGPGRNGAAKKTKVAARRRSA